MKVFRVVTERDGATTREPGISSTELKRAEYRYAAETMEQVWDAIDWMRHDEECTVIAIIEEAPGITVLHAETKEEG